MYLVVLRYFHIWIEAICAIVFGAHPQLLLVSQNPDSSPYILRAACVTNQLLMSGHMCEEVVIFQLISLVVFAHTMMRCLLQ